jgi:hypothetical protein
MVPEKWSPQRTEGSQREQASLEFI